MEPENHWVVEEHSLPGGPFSGSMLIFPHIHLSTPPERKKEDLEDALYQVKSMSSVWPKPSGKKGWRHRFVQPQPHLEQS